MHAQYINLEARPWPTNALLNSDGKVHGMEHWNWSEIITHGL